VKGTVGNEVKELVRALERQDGHAARLERRKEARARRRRGEPPALKPENRRQRGTCKK